MKFNLLKLAMILLITSVLTSCYTTYSIYKGNVYQDAIGLNKNQVLRNYGVPDKTTDDDAGGTIMMYEKFTQTTTVNANSGTYGKSNTVGAAVYGKNGVVAGKQTEHGSVSQMNGISQTSTDKTFHYFYLDKNNVVYDFNANHGAKYEYDRCFNKTLTWIGVGTSCLLIYPAIITVPWAIIAQSKAKKKGNICK